MGNMHLLRSSHVLIKQPLRTVLVDTFWGCAGAQPNIVRVNCSHGIHAPQSKFAEADAEGFLSPAELKN